MLKKGSDILVGVPHGGGCHMWGWGLTVKPCDIFEFASFVLSVPGFRLPNGRLVQLLQPLLCRSYDFRTALCTNAFNGA